MTEDTEHSPHQMPPCRPQMTADEARLIAKAILSELSSNLTTYVGRGVLSMIWKTILLVGFAIALWGWAHMDNMPHPNTSPPAGH